MYKVKIFKSSVPSTLETSVNSFLSGKAYSITELKDIKYSTAAYDKTVVHSAMIIYR